MSEKIQQEKDFESTDAKQEKMETFINRVKMMVVLLLMSITAIAICMTVGKVGWIWLRVFI